MNYMKKQQQHDLTALSDMADLVGDFIRYWGFRKIHGELWTVIYLSKQPLSGSELVEILQVSKALVSPALKELEAEGLIFQTDSENSKTKRYSAAEDVFKVIKNVLDRREKPMIQQILNAQTQLDDELSDTASACHQLINEDRYTHLKNMTEMAQMGLMMIADLELTQEIDQI